MVTIPDDGAAGWVDSSLPETLPGQVTAMTAAASNAAPGHGQPFRSSQSVVRFLIMARISDVGDSMSH
jgi:hypothetical protein